MSKKPQAQPDPVPEPVPSRVKLVGGNWKSNGSLQFVRDISNTVLNKITIDPAKVEVVIAPMMIHIPSAKAMLLDKIQVSAQNISATQNGAFTGEVSAE